MKNFEAAPLPTMWGTDGCWLTTAADSPSPAAIDCPSQRIILGESPDGESVVSANHFRCANHYFDRLGNLREQQSIEINLLRSVNGIYTMFGGSIAVASTSVNSVNNFCNSLK